MNNNTISAFAKRQCEIFIDTTRAVLEPMTPGFAYKGRGHRFETRCHRFETRGHKLESRCHRFETNYHRLETKGHRFETRGHRFQTRGHRFQTCLSLGYIASQKVRLITFVVVYAPPHSTNPLQLLWGNSCMLLQLLEAVSERMGGR